MVVAIDKPKREKSYFLSIDCPSCDKELHFEEEDEIEVPALRFLFCKGSKAILCPVCGKYIYTTKNSIHLYKMKFKCWNPDYNLIKEK